MLSILIFPDKMACVTVDEGGRVLICSGSKICSVENMNLDSIKVFQPTHRQENGADKQSGHTDTENGAKVIQNGAKVKKNGGENKENGTHIVCMGLSGCGEYLAVCGENKTLSVFHNNNPGKLLIINLSSIAKPFQ